MQTCSLPTLASVNMPPSWLEFGIYVSKKNTYKVNCVCVTSEAGRHNFDEQGFLSIAKRLVETGSSGQYPQNGQVSLRSATHSKLLGKTLVGWSLKDASTEKIMRRRCLRPLGDTSFRLISPDNTHVGEISLLAKVI